MPEAADNVVVAEAGASDEMSLLDLLDHVLTTGVVVRGSLVISLAGVDLVYLGLDVVLASVETALRQLPEARLLSRALPSSALPRKQSR
ncbi:MAG TPA: gas vesicle protein [Terriglobales bacterium]|nr:gas vesicle protein [Terriglobales bacterium]